MALRKDVLSAGLRVRIHSLKLFTRQLNKVKSEKKSSINVANNFLLNFHVEEGLRKTNKLPIFFEKERGCQAEGFHKAEPFHVYNPTRSFFGFHCLSTICAELQLFR